jgi:hypothetical protein
VPEFIDERFGLVFTKTASIISGTGPGIKQMLMYEQVWYWNSGPSPVPDERYLNADAGSIGLDVDAQYICLIRM